MGKREEVKKKNEKLVAAIRAVYFAMPNGTGTIQAAYNIYMERHPTKKNDISLVTVKRWAANQHWVDEYLANNPAVVRKSSHHVRKIRQIKAEIGQYIGTANPETIAGLQGMILDKMIQELQLIKLDTVEKYNDMLAVVNYMETFKHELRGNIVRGDNPGQATPSDGEQENILDYKSFTKQIRHSDGQT